MVLAPVWYVPAPKSQIKSVELFYPTAKHARVSLKEPGVTNSLLGVLVLYNNKAVGVVGDIQQIFYCFSVREDHRNFLRFLWYRNNDPTLGLTETRMCKQWSHTGPEEQHMRQQMTMIPI